MAITPALAKAMTWSCTTPTRTDREMVRFTFPRQSGRKRLCISDFFRPVDAGEKDVLGLTCVTMGPEVSVRAKALFDANNYTEYLYLHGLRCGMCRGVGGAVA